MSEAINGLLKEEQMNLKSPSERIASLRRKECVVEDCTRPTHSFGFCRECMDEMNDRMVKFSEAIKSIRTRELQ